MKKQKVVRIYLNGQTYTTGHLQKAMDEGYYVVMCNKMTFKDNTEVLEYIVEKKEECYD